MADTNRSDALCAVIIPAGGSGKRMGGVIPKQYIRIGRLRILEHTLSVFQNHKSVAEIVLILPQSDISGKTRLLKARFPKISAVVVGGKTRTVSVNNGFDALKSAYNKILVHDAVRPFVRPVDITRLLEELDRADAATLAVPVKDTIKRVRGTRILGTPDRTELWHTLTPQAFKTSVLAAALDYARKTGRSGTDECMLAERMGKKVTVVKGHYYNIKITTPEDLIFARAILADNATGRGRAFTAPSKTTEAP